MIGILEFVPNIAGDMCPLVTSDPPASHSEAAPLKAVEEVTISCAGPATGVYSNVVLRYGAKLINTTAAPVSDRTTLVPACSTSDVEFAVLLSRSPSSIVGIDFSAQLFRIGPKQLGVAMCSSCTSKTHLWKAKSSDTSRRRMSKQDSPYQGDQSSSRPDSKIRVPPWSRDESLGALGDSQQTPPICVLTNPEAGTSCHQPQPSSPNLAPPTEAHRVAHTLSTA
ncbi:unnamed protein product [Calicophoron daubneyi]|uniref:Uncharacterized protein n=1 Tax=Calicophoron daubneyi TaxID=300641 RepID=A0AAV2TB50_CALDB